MYNYCGVICVAGEEGVSIVRKFKSELFELGERGGRELSGRRGRVLASVDIT